MNDGLEDVTLALDWCDSAAGSVVRVDPGRAAWLRGNGFALQAELSTARKKKREKANG
jgi:hypothetical protein